MGVRHLIFDDDEFFTLQRKWYEKLKSKGFDDIEKVNRNKSFLTQYHSHYFFRNHSPNEIQETQDYYRMAYNFYWHFSSFKSKQEKLIWRLHCEGFSNRDIIKKTKLTYYKIQNMIARLRKLMHSGTWSSSEGTDSDR